MKKAFWTYIFGLILFGSNGVAASCIHLTSQKQVGLGDALTLQVTEESTIARMLANQINKCHAQHKDGSRNASVL